MLTIILYSGILVANNLYIFENERSPLRYFLPVSRLHKWLSYAVDFLSTILLTISFKLTLEICYVILFRLAVPNCNLLYAVIADATQKI